MRPKPPPLPLKKETQPYEPTLSLTPSWRPQRVTPRLLQQCRRRRLILRLTTMLLLLRPGSHMALPIPNLLRIAQLVLRELSGCPQEPGAGTTSPSRSSETRNRRYARAREGRTRGTCNRRRNTGDFTEQRAYPQRCRRTRRRACPSCLPGRSQKSTQRQRATTA